MTKQELFKGYARRMDGFGFYLGENEAYDLMDEYAEREATGFIHWITNEQKWVRDHVGNWMERKVATNPKTITTNELYQLYKNNHQ